MTDKLARLCSLGLALALIAGWLGFGYRARLVYPPQDEPSAQTAPAPASYHSAPAPDPLSSPKTTACSSCHGDYPHKRTAFTKAFLNLHVARLDCMACHVDPKKKSETRLGWFESSPTGPKKSSGENMAAFLTRHTEKSGKHVILESRSKEAPANIVSDGKHQFGFDKPSCSACHSSGGLSNLKDAGYNGESLAKPGKLENIVSFTEGKVFFYPRF